MKKCDPELLDDLRHISATILDCMQTADWTLDELKDALAETDTTAARTAFYTAVDAIESAQGAAIKLASLVGDLDREELFSLAIALQQRASQNPSPRE